MAIDPNSSQINAGNYDDWKAGLDDAQRDVDNLNNSKDVKDMVDKLNRLELKDANGKVVKFDNLADWKKALDTGTLKFKSGYPAKSPHPEFDVISSYMYPTMRKLESAMNKLEQFKGSVESYTTLHDCLKAGDIEGAIMAILQQRAKGLEDQLTAKLEEMNQRNINIDNLNKQLAAAQGPPKNEGECTRISGLISTANNQSQQEMIKLQQLVNKRNEAYDMMTNIMQKLQKTMDGIVSNMR